METKYQKVERIYSEVCANVVGSAASWQDFLSAAARSYKYTFNEQLLIYAQRPDATAVATTQMWNTRFNR